MRGSGRQNGCCEPPHAPVPSPRPGASASRLSQLGLAGFHACLTLRETEAGEGPGTQERDCPDIAPDPPRGRERQGRSLESQTGAG